MIRFPGSLIFVAAVMQSGNAAGYPERPIRFVVPSASGSASDSVARVVGRKLTEQMGQQVIVDTRSGASGLIGIEIVKHAAADGYTILLAATTQFSTLPALKSDLPYNPDKDFAALTRIASAANVVTVHAGLGVNTVTELIKLAKAKPGQLNYGSSGNGTPAHLAGIMLNVLAGVDMLHVPYKGAPQALTDVIAGQLQILITSPLVGMPHARAGRLKALATTGAMRDPLIPELPPVAETVPGYELTQWWGVAVRRETPPSIAARLHAEVTQALRTPGVRDLLAELGATAQPESPVEFLAYMKKERIRTANLGKQARIKLD